MAKPKWRTISLLTVILDRVEKQVKKKNSTSLSISDYCSKAIVDQLKEDEK
jgi:hypothetical protein